MAIHKDRRGAIDTCSSGSKNILLDMLNSVLGITILFEFIHVKTNVLGKFDEFLWA